MKMAYLKRRNDILFSIKYYNKEIEEQEKRIEKCFKDIKKNEKKRYKITHDILIKPLKYAGKTFISHDYNEPIETLLNFIFNKSILKTKEDIIQYHREMILKDNEKIIRFCNDKILRLKREEYKNKNKKILKIVNEFS
jgi:hypothetical protein